MVFRSLCLLGLGFLILGGLSPAAAQWENIDTVKGSQGEEITLTATPHSIGEGTSARAMCISSPDTVRWALSILGVTASDTIRIRYGNDSLPIKDVERPDDETGPTKIYVSESTFLTMAETKAVTLQIGDEAASLPAKLRREMKEIFERGT